MRLAVPNGSGGSGLTVVVGPNNSGKSTIIESLTAISQSKTPTFSEGKRNKAAGERVVIRIVDNQGHERVLRTVASGGSQAEFGGEQTNPTSQEVFVLPSRRSFAPFFGKGSRDRNQYALAQQLGATREGATEFAGRLFQIVSNAEQREEFDNVLSNVLDPVPDWTIDQSDQGAYYLKYTKGDLVHSSDGLGEGLLNVIFIVDALYDSKPGTVVAIDEPELSLHPQLQKRVLNLLFEYAADRQIVLATHSPKFISWDAIAAGAQIVRISSVAGSPEVGELSDGVRRSVAGFLADLNNPHVLGLDANEVFFLGDKVIMVEGQEDVMFFPKVLSDLGKTLSGDFYGWGVGGADKMTVIAGILSDLGFKKVAGILDADRAADVATLQEAFPNFFFVHQPADDIRYKKDRPDKTSLLSEDNRTVREEFRPDTIEVLDSVERYLSG